VVGCLHGALPADAALMQGPCTQQHMHTAAHAHSSTCTQQHMHIARLRQGAAVWSPQQTLIVVPHTCTLTPVHSHLCTHTCTLTPVHSHLYTHTCTLTPVHSHLYTHTCTLTSVHSHLYTHTCTLTPVHSHLCTLSHPSSSSPLLFLLTLPGGAPGWPPGAGLQPAGPGRRQARRGALRG
jgi:hypothetical protein